MSDNVKYPPYTPMKSLGHELGILFGFLAACVLTVGVYYVLWNTAQRRETMKDQARRAELRARGFHHGRGGYHEKMLERFADHHQPPSSQSQGQGQVQAQYQSLSLPRAPASAAVLEEEDQNLPPSATAQGDMAGGSPGLQQSRTMSASGVGGPHHNHHRTEAPTTTITTMSGGSGSGGTPTHHAQELI